jgi:hypothetical protein
MTALPTPAITPALRTWRSWLRSLKLESGGHRKPEDGMCLMEAVSYMQGQPFSDHPACVSPVIGAFGRSWNDKLDDAGRQRLKRFIPIMVGTATTKDDDAARAWLATDWMVRTFTPAWLDKAGLATHAQNLRNLDALTSAELARKAMPIIEDAKKASAAVGAAVGAAVVAAVGAAVGDAVGAAAWAAVGAAVVAAVGDAVGDAVGAAVVAAVGAAAWAAVGAAAWAAVVAAVGDAVGDAQYNAAYKAARPLMDAAFADTVAELHASAEDLLERMCAVGRSA